MEQFTTINDSLTLFKMQITNLQKVVKTVEKDVKKELKNIKKDKKKEKPKSKRAPSGFAKPTKVTKELCEFMNKPEGSEIARTEVTKALVNYIKENNLIELGEDSKNKIVPDEKLKSLLGIHDEELNDLTYFNIQKYMNKHFYSKKEATLNT
jgi:chromatin remodeling complex protein RSC6